MAKFKPATKEDWLFFATTGGAGAIGGFTICLIQGTWDLSHVGLDIPLGAIVGFLGTTLLNIDPSNWRRLVVAAILCGIYPASILDMGKRMIDRREAISSSQIVIATATELETVSIDQFQTTLMQTIQLADEAIEKSSLLDNSTTRTTISRNIGAALNIIVQEGPKNSISTVNAIERIGSAAAKHGNQIIVNEVLNSLGAIQHDPRYDSISQKKATDLATSISNRYK